MLHPSTAPYRSTAPHRYRRYVASTAVLLLAVAPLIAAPHAHSAVGVRGRDAATHSAVTQTGANPIAVTVDARTGRVFVVAEGPIGSSPYPEPTGPGSVSVLDAATGHLVRTTRIGVHPLQTALDDTTGRVYVLNQGALSKAGGLGPGSVSVLDAATGHLVRTTPVGVGVATLAVDAQRRRVFALPLDPGSNEISTLDIWATNGPSHISGDTRVLDAATGRVVQTLPHTTGTALAANDHANRLLVASGVDCSSHSNDEVNPGCLRVYEETTGRLLATRPLSQTVAPGAMAPDDLNGRVLAFLESARSTLDDQGSNHVVAFGSWGGKGVYSASLNDAGGTAGAFTTSVTANRAVVVTIPDAYQVQEGGGTAYASILDMRQGRVLHTGFVGGGQSARYGYRASVAIDAPMGRIIVLTEQLVDTLGHPGGTAALTIIDTHTGRSLRTVRAQPGDIALGLDVTRGHLFVVNARSNTVRMLDVARL